VESSLTATLLAGSREISSIPELLSENEPLEEGELLEDKLLEDKLLEDESLEEVELLEDKSLEEVELLEDDESLEDELLKDELLEVEVELLSFLFFPLSEVTISESLVSDFPTPELSEITVSEPVVSEFLDPEFMLSELGSVFPLFESLRCESVFEFLFSAS
jgi:hypothetical protein